MSIEKSKYNITDIDNKILTKEDLYSKLIEGMNDIKGGNTRPFNEAMEEIKSHRQSNPEF